MAVNKYAEKPPIPTDRYICPVCGCKYPKCPLTDGRRLCPLCLPKMFELEDVDE